MVHNGAYKEFDERQVGERGKVFKRAYLLLFALFLLYMFLVDSGIIPSKSLFGAGVLFITLSIAAVSIELIFRGAYIDTRRSKQVIFLVAILSCVALFLIGIYIVDAAQGKATLIDGSFLTHSGVTLATGLLYLSIPSSYILKRFLDARAEKNE